MQETQAIIDAVSSPEVRGPLAWLHEEHGLGKGSNGGTSPVPKGQQWIPHVGSRQVYREHKRAWAQFEKMTKNDGYTAATRERLLDFMAESFEDPSRAEVEAMRLVLQCRCLVEDRKDKGIGVVGETLTYVLNQALNELEAARPAVKSAL